MTRLLSLLLEYVNIVSAILVIMSIAGLITLVVGEPARDSLFVDLLIVLIGLTVLNGFIAALVSIKRHAADIRTDKTRQLRLLRRIVDLNTAGEVEAQKRLNMKYPPTNI